MQTPSKVKVKVRPRQTPQVTYDFGDTPQNPPRVKVCEAHTALNDLQSSVDFSVSEVHSERGEFTPCKIQESEKAMSIAKIYSTNTLMKDVTASLCFEEKLKDGSSHYNTTQAMSYSKHQSNRQRNSADILSCGSSFDALPKEVNQIKNNFTQYKNDFSRVEDSISQRDTQRVQDQRRNPFVRSVKYNQTPTPRSPLKNPLSYKSALQSKLEEQKFNFDYSDEDDDNFSEEVDECSIIEQEEQLAATLKTMQGPIYKKTKGEWKRRYGVVRNKKFKYYKDKTMREVCGVFDFDRIQCVVMIDDGQQVFSSEDESDGEGGFQEPKMFRIEVIGCKRQFIFECPQSKSLREWTQALYANWHASKSFQLINEPNILRSKFWKNDVIAFDEFRKIADTGDIVLFKGNSFVTRVQRAITMSDYDHVAMALRYSNGKLVLFESTGSTGVAVLDWDIFVKNNWHSLYQKLAFRKLRFTRTLENMQKLESFIRGVIGMKYKLTASKIFKKYEKHQQEDKSYFCSELVASAYKCLGLLPEEIASSQYWPGSFANRGGIKLMNLAMLEDEQIIEFET